MNKLEKIKKYYEKGLYTDEHLSVLLSKGVITQDEYNEIIK